MSLKEDVEKVQEKIEVIEQQSFAMDLLKDYKRQNKRQFIIILVILCMWFITGCYLVYILNDVGTSEETIDIQDVENIDNSHIKIDDEIWEKSN